MLAYTGLCAAAWLFVVIWLRLPRPAVAQPPQAAAATAPADDDQPQPLQPQWQRVLRSLYPIVTSADVWLLQIVFVLLFGCGVNFYSTSGSIVLSLGGTDNEGRYLFILFCIGQTAARLTATPYIGAKASRIRMIRVLAIDAIVMTAVGALAASINSTALMYGMAVCNGAAYGSLWVILLAFRDVDLVLDAATAANYGTSGYILNGFMNIGPAVGPALFGKVSGVLYDRLADSAHLCYGLACYSTYFFVHVGAAAVAGVLVVVLAYRTRPPRGNHNTGDFARLADGVHC